MLFLVAFYPACQLTHTHEVSSRTSDLETALLTPSPIPLNLTDRHHRPNRPKGQLPSPKPAVSPDIQHPLGKKGGGNSGAAPHRRRLRSVGLSQPRSLSPLRSTAAARRLQSLAPGSWRLASLGCRFLRDSVVRGFRSTARDHELWRSSVFWCVRQMGTGMDAGMEVWREEMGVVLGRYGYTGRVCLPVRLFAF